MSAPNTHLQESTEQELYNEHADHKALRDVEPSTRLARNYILRRAARPVVDARGSLGTVVDVGCGSGAGAIFLKGLYQKYLGIDFSAEMVARGRELLAGESNVDFVVGNIKSQDLPESVADTILVYGSFHHMTELDKVMSSLQHIAKPGAHLIAVEPHRGNPIVGILRAIRMRLDSSYSSDQVFFSEEEMRTLLQTAGLQEVSIEYLAFLVQPFSQIPLRPEWLFKPVISALIGLEYLLDAFSKSALGKASWMMAAYGRFPEK